MQQPSLGFVLHEHFLGILELGHEGLLGPLRRFPGMSAGNRITATKSLREVAEVLLKVPVDLKFGLGDLGSGIRYRKYRLIRPGHQLEASKTGSLAYIQLHLVAGDLEVDIIELQ